MRYLRENRSVNGTDLKEKALFVYRSYMGTARNFEDTALKEIERKMHAVSECYIHWYEYLFLIFIAVVSGMIPIIRLEIDIGLRRKKAVDEIYVDDKVKNYIVDIVVATRKPEKFGLEHLKNFIAFGASPRATINLIRSGKALAFLKGRGFVTPEDIKDVGLDVLRHRVLTTYDADAQELTSDDIIKQIFDGVEVP